jgi:hypothetical protein
MLGMKDKTPLLALPLPRSMMLLYPVPGAHGSTVEGLYSNVSGQGAGRSVLS